MYNYQMKIKEGVKNMEILPTSPQEEQEKLEQERLKKRIEDYIIEYGEKAVNAISATCWKTQASPDYVTKRLDDALLQVQSEAEELAKKRKDEIFVQKKSNWLPLEEEVLKYEQAANQYIQDMTALMREDIAYITSNSKYNSTEGKFRENYMANFSHPSEEELQTKIGELKVQIGQLQGTIDSVKSEINSIRQKALQRKSTISKKHYDILFRTTNSEEDNEKIRNAYENYSLKVNIICEECRKKMGLEDLNNLIKRANEIVERFEGIPKKIQSGLSNSIKEAHGIRSEFPSLEVISNYLQSDGVVVVPIEQQTKYIYKLVEGPQEGLYTYEYFKSDSSDATTIKSPYSPDAIAIYLYSNYIEIFSDDGKAVPNSLPGIGAVKPDFSFWNQRQKTTTPFELTEAAFYERPNVTKNEPKTNHNTHK